MKPRNPPRTSRAKPAGGRPAFPTPQTAEPDVTPEPTGPLGVDPELVDPLRILAAIAIDANAPAPARVAACKVLLAAGPGAGKPVVPDTHQDALTRRTLALMKQKGRPN